MPNQRIRGNQITDQRTIIQNEHDERSDSKRVLIVDEDGNPINSDNPLHTNATFTGSLSVELDPQNDGVHLGDKVTGDMAQIDPERRLRVLDADSKAVLDAIQAAVTNPANLAQQSTLQAVLLNLTDVLAALNTSVEIRSLNANRDDVLVAGSEDGTATGTIRHLVYNLRQQILASHDRQRNFSWSDFGTKSQRISQMDYQSSTFPGVTARKSFNYTQIGNRYRLDSEVWSIII